MNVTFDGSNKLCVLGSGVVGFEVIELYSDWKTWMLIGDNSKYLQAFRSVGGDPLGGGAAISPYYFLMNGWRVRPQEANHELVVLGNLLTEEGAASVIPTVGAYNVTVRMVTSSNSTVQVVSSSGSSPLTAEEHDRLFAIPLQTLTTEEHDQLMGLVSSLGTMVVEGELSFLQAMRLMLSVLAGKSTGGGTLAVAFRDLADSKDRIQATVDANGNRLSVVRDGA